ncbi:MAG: hypothetical protein HC894_32020 [Microcoleus sp. SM1_3_4]|nr:hypothetical protein [Microcoleus sp. SM1_3_4]
MVYDFIWEEIETIEECGDDECYDITLLEEDSLDGEPNFIADGFVVHNCGMAERYVKRKKNEEEYELHPILEPILGKTYGVQTYQEQVMKILHVVGGIPLKDCEKVRKAISKKKEEVFVKYKPQFIEMGSVKLQRDCDIELEDDFNEVIKREYAHSEDMEYNIKKIADYPLKRINRILMRRV